MWLSKLPISNLNQTFHLNFVQFYPCRAMYKGANGNLRHWSLFDTSWKVFFIVHLVIPSKTNREKEIWSMRYVSFSPCNQMITKGFKFNFSFGEYFFISYSRGSGHTDVNWPNSNLLYLQFLWKKRKKSRGHKLGYYLLVDLQFVFGQEWACN